MCICFYLKPFNPLFVLAQTSLVYLDGPLHHRRHLVDLVYVRLHFLQRQNKSVYTDPDQSGWALSSIVNRIKTGFVKCDR